MLEAGYAPQVAEDGLTGYHLAKTNPFDLILLDVMLPGLTGFEVCRRLRGDGIATPILILTAKDLLEDKVMGLDSGADDYLVKPFNIDELLARVRALLRRRPFLRSPVLVLDTLEVDTRSRTVRRAGEFVRVTATEYALLECLAQDADTLLDRDTISRRVWNEPYDPFSNLIEEYIKRLRRKIDVQGQKALIQGRRGEGYILTAREFA